MVRCKCRPHSTPISRPNESPLNEVQRGGEYPKHVSTMRILIASSEVHPYSKSGGLADMVGALAKSLARAGHQVGLVTPLYKGILERFPEIRKFDWQIDLPLGLDRVRAEIWTATPSEGLTIYFVD